MPNRFIILQNLLNIARQLRFCQSCNILAKLVTLNGRVLCQQGSNSFSLLNISNFKAKAKIISLILLTTLVALDEREWSYKTVKTFLKNNLPSFQTFRASPWHPTWPLTTSWRLIFRPSRQRRTCRKTRAAAAGRPSTMTSTSSGPPRVFSF